MIPPQWRRRRGARPASCPMEQKNGWKRWSRWWRRRFGGEGACWEAADRFNCSFSSTKGLFIGKARGGGCFQACRALEGTDVAVAILWRAGRRWHRYGLTLPSNGKCQTDATVLCFQFICSHKEFKGQHGQKTKELLWFDVHLNRLVIWPHSVPSTAR